jgi:hypothetical protein
MGDSKPRPQVGSPLWPYTHHTCAQTRPHTIVQYSQVHLHARPHARMHTSNTHTYTCTHAALACTDARMHARSTRRNTHAHAQVLNQHVHARIYCTQPGWFARKGHFRGVSVLTLAVTTCGPVASSDMKGPTSKKRERKKGPTTNSSISHLSLSLSRAQTEYAKLPGLPRGKRPPHPRPRLF